MAQTATIASYLRDGGASSEDIDVFMDFWNMFKDQ